MIKFHDLPLRCNRRNIAIHDGEFDLSEFENYATEMLQSARNQLMTPLYWILTDNSLTLHCRDWKCFGFDFVQKLE